MTHVKSIEEIRLVLSDERCAKYVMWAASCPEKALSLYNLNTALSEALYTPIQALELALRNQIHAAMAATHGERWFEADGVLQVAQQSEQLVEAKDKLTTDGKPHTSGQIVAALSFSFWTTMFSNTYEPLWRSTLHRIATAPTGKRVDRKTFSRPLTQIRLLRNRVAHHEPILHWNLPKHHDSIRRLLAYLSDAAVAWCDCMSRFPSIYPAAGYTLAVPAGPTTSSTAAAALPSEVEVVPPLRTARLAKPGTESDPS